MNTWRRILFLFSLGAGFLLLAPPAAVAQDAAIASRMKARLSAVDSLLQNGLAGEDNRGFLSPRATLSAEQQRIVDDENRDRSAVYAALAAKTGQSAEVVGKNRATQLRQRLVAGVWIQTPEGKWIRK